MVISNPLPESPVSKTSEKPRFDPTATRYLGSKVRVTDSILAIVGPPQTGAETFHDGFSGTGVVAAAAADVGWDVVVNDHLLSAVCMSLARLVARDEVAFTAHESYEAAIAELNAMQPIKGFFFHEYSPGGSRGRMYFTEENASQIDAIRDAVETWRASGWISEIERRLLVADLIAASARVANVAGTYGCFLTHWSGNAKRKLELVPRKLRSARIEWQCSCQDVSTLITATDDVAYLDPPYTKRQYAAYYHINETLAYGDEPKLVGKTGLRPWQDRASDYCYKARALEALCGVVERIDARRALISYSSEGHVRLSDLVSGLRPYGAVTLHKLASIGRYRPNAAASAANHAVTEYLIEVLKR
jgi:adenine-specific DNA-methyltransferase